MKNTQDYRGGSHRGKGPKATALELTHVIGWRVKPPSARCGQSFTLSIKKSSLLRCGWRDFSVLTSSMLQRTVSVHIYTATSVSVTKSGKSFPSVKPSTLKAQRGSSLGLLKAGADFEPRPSDDSAVAPVWGPPEQSRQRPSKFPRKTAASVYSLRYQCRCGSGRGRGDSRSRKQPQLTRRCLNRNVPSAGNCFQRS